MADHNLGTVYIGSRFLTGLFRRDIDKFHREIQRNDRVVRAWNRSYRQINRSIGRTGTSLARAATGIGALTAAYAGVTRASIEFARGLQQAADRAQLGVEEFQAYSVAMEGLGADADDVRDGLSDINEAISELAVTGGGPLQDFVDTLGAPLQANLQQATTASERLRLVFRRLAEIDPNQLQFIATRLTDSTFGQILTQFIRRFEGDLDQVQAAMRRRGLILPASATSAAVSLGGEIRTLEILLRNNFARLLVTNTEALQGLLGGIERQLPEFNARVLGMVDAIDRNFGPIAFLAQHGSILGASLAPGAAIGRAAGDLRLATLRGEQAAAQTLLQSATIRLGDLQREQAELERNAFRSHEQNRRLLSLIEKGGGLETADALAIKSTKDLQKHTNAINKATGAAAAFTRGALGVAGTFGVLEIATRALSYAFNKLTEVTPADLTERAEGLVESLKAAIASGDKVLVDSIRGRMATLLDLEAQLSRKSLQDLTEGHREAVQKLAELDPLQRGRERQSREARVKRFAEELKRETEAAEERAKANEELARTHDVETAAIKRLGQEERQREAALRAVLPLLSRQRQAEVQLKDSQDALSRALTLGAISRKEFAEGTEEAKRQVEEFVRELERERHLLDLDTEAIIRNTRAREEMASAINQQIDAINRQIGQGPQGGLGGAERAEQAIREQFERERVAREEALRIAELERANVEAGIKAERDLLRKTRGGNDLEFEFDAGPLGQADAQVQEATARLEAFRKQEAQIESLIDAERRLAEQQEVWRTQEDAIRAFSRGIADVMTTAITDVDNLGKAFLRLGTNILEILLDKTIQAAIFGHGGASGFAGAGNFLGSLFGRQFGGPVYSGQAAIVGENGPELITPTSSVKVAPLGNGAVGGVINNNPVINIYPVGMSPNEIATAVDLKIRANNRQVAAANKLNQMTQLNPGARR